MRRISLSLFIAILVVNSPVVYGATTAELQAQIAALLQQVQALQAQLQVVSPPTGGLTEGAIILNNTLRRGSTDATTGGEVTKLQQFLATDKTIYPEALVTGYFGALTETAVKRWQAKNGIEAVGIIGPKTRTAIKQLTAAAVTPPVSTAPTSTSATSTPAETSPPPSLGQITLSPSLGRVGDVITITGSGFTPAGNNIHFGIGGVKNVSSFNDGRMITFPVPREISACDLIDSSITACLAPDVRVIPGSYTIYVSNVNGNTVTTTFTVVLDIPSPSVILASPSTARIGETVTVYGSGFVATGNEVHLGVGGMRIITILSQFKDTILTFQVPPSINNCDFPTSSCINRSYSLVPGDYSLYVVNDIGQSNSVKFTVTSY